MIRPMNLASPFDAEVLAFTEIVWDSITQASTLKPVHVFRYADIGGTAWWRQVVGTTWSAYFETHRLGAVLTYVRLEMFEHSITPLTPARVRWTTHLGKFPDTMRPPRYGGVDMVALETREGTSIARVRSTWLWFHIPEDGSKPGTIDRPPPGFPVERSLKPPPSPPELEDREVPLIQRFRWSERDTDLNQHVNSIAYWERFENALADWGRSLPVPGSFAIWYRKPAFLGQWAHVGLLDDDPPVLRIVTPEGLCQALFSLRPAPE